ncbi:MAG: MarR family winged helix-turn-helix transcriptional regulator [Gaiellales bacterium]
MCNKFSVRKANTLRTTPDHQLNDTELAAWKGFLSAHHGLVARLDAELVQRHRLPLSSYEVLLQLANGPAGGMRMSDIAERVFLSRSGLTRLVDRLVREGLVERRSCPSDLRGQLALITDRGREVFAEARSTHLEGVRREYLERFSEPELADLAELWTRFEGPEGSSC